MDGFYILARVIPAACKEDMLGRVIVDKDYPLREFAPDEDLPQPQAIVRNLFPQAVPYSTLAEAFNTAQCDTVGVGLTEFLKAHWGKETLKHKYLTAAPAAHYTMTQVPKKFNRLMENDHYKREVVELLENQGNKSLPMVTGVFTCKNLEIHFGENATKAAGGKFKVPVGEATMTSKVVNPELEINHTVSADGGSIVTIEEEVIIALEYTDLRMKYQHERRPPLFLKSRIGTPTVAVGKQVKSPRFALFYAGEAEDGLYEEEVEATIEVEARKSPFLDCSV